jgi:hypothetical protein
MEMVDLFAPKVVLEDKMISAPMVLVDNSM